MGFLYRKFHAYRLPLWCKLALPALLVCVFVVACAALQSRERVPEGDPESAPEPAEETPRDTDRPPIASEPAPEPEIPEERREPLAERIDVEIATWPRSKQAAVSFTFDDGTRDHYRVAFPILEEHGIRASFYVISHLLEYGYWDDFGTVREVMSWDEVAELADAGHEIGGHSATHVDLSETEADLPYEIEESMRYIEERLAPVTVDTFSWPFWRSTSEGRAIAGETYLAARGGAPLAYRPAGNSIESATIHDRYDVDSLALLPPDFHGEWQDTAGSIIADNGWVVISLHGIREDGISQNKIGWEAIEVEQLVEIIEHFKEQDVWIAPFREVVAYKLHRREAVVSVRSLDEKSAEIQFEGYEDASHLDIPITLRVHADGELDCLQGRPSNPHGGVELELRPQQEVRLECSLD